jgi:autotransporter-associated beta strand protein
MRSQNSGYSARAELADLNLNTNGGDFLTAGIVSYDGTMPAMQMYGANINTGAGDITLYGYSHPSQNNTFGGVRVNNTNLTTTSGAITINGIIASNSTHTLTGTRAVHVLGTSAIQSTSGNISINGSIINTADPTYITEIAHSGALTTSGDINIQGNNNGSITTPIGVYIASPLTTIGNLVLSGNDVYVGKNISLSGAAKTLVINATEDFYSLDGTGTERIVFTTNNGNITINADSDANNTGVLELDYLTLNAGSANTIIRGSTMNWVVTNNTDKPYINGTGTFTFEPNAAAFGQDIRTLWFNIDQDANGIAGITLGKTTNNAPVYLNHNNTITLNGPLNVYGGMIIMSSALSATGNVLLDANLGSFLTQDSKGIDISAALTTTNNGNITLLGRGGSGNSQSANHGVYITNLVEAGGSGTITLEGYGGLAANGAGSSCHGVYLEGNNAWVKSNGGAITINGYGGGTGTGSYSQGFAMATNSKLSAAGSGSIDITGLGGVNTAPGLRGVVIVSGSSIFSAGGPINITGTNGTNGTDNSDGITIDNATIGSASSGAITLTGYGGNGTNSEAISLSTNSIIGAVNHAFPIFIKGNTYAIASAASITSNGALTIEPTGSSFASTFTYPGAFLTVANTVTGLTLGKATNTADITISNAATANGPINLYGGTLTLNANIGSTNTSNGDILLKGTALAGTGNITVPNTRNLTFNLSANTTYSNAINGTNVSITKDGAGALTLAAACGYTGSTTVNAGTLQINENKAFNAITIANGATLALGPNKQFDLNSTLANNGTLNLKSGATILHGGSNTISGTGSYVVEQAITGSNSGGTPNGRFWYLGSPVVGAFSTAYNAGGPNVLKYRDEPNNQWVEITNDGTALNIGQGYYCQVANNSTLSFAGSAINNGAITTPNLTSTGSGFTGFNLVSNPYPSYLDWTSVTKTNVEGTMWYRTHDGTSMNFGTVNASGVGTTVGNVVLTKYIPPMQSFWVRVANYGQAASLTFDNTGRSHFVSENSSVAGLKSSNGGPAFFIRMNLLQGQKSDQIVLYTDEQSSNGLDINDAEKMMQATNPQFYTMVGAQKTVINALNPSKKQQSLPITMELPTTGVHSFVIEDLEISNGLVWLEDKQEEIMQALEPGTVYEFYANSGINAERFVLHFQLIDDATPINVYNEVNGSANFSGKGASVHAESAGVVVIKLPATTEGVTDIQIRDAAGKLVYSGSTNTLETSVQLVQANGIYYVTLNSASGVEVRKVFIQQ